MSEQFQTPRYTNPTLAAIYDASGPQLDALTNDRAFQTAVEALDLEAASQEFNTFTEKITAYNVLHRRERRLWSLKIGKGGIPPELESQFIKAIPEMRQNYLEAFAAAGNVLDSMSRAKFDTAMERHLTPLTSNFANDKHPFTQVITGYFQQIGCAPEMMDEFRRNFEITDYDLLAVTKGKFAGLRDLTDEAVQAQVSIMDYTEKEGFSYLRGECGPPSWAVAVAAILASIGISISAWIVILIIVALFAILILICNASTPGSWLRKQCEKVKVKFPIFNF